MFEAPNGCSGVAVTPSNAKAAWAGLSLEIAGLPAGEIIGQSSGKIARWVYADQVTTVKGSLACPALGVAGVRTQANDGSTFDLTLQRGWNLVLTDAQETGFVSAPLSTTLTWSATTPNDLGAATGLDGGSSATRLKGTLGIKGYNLALQIKKPGSDLPSPPLAAPTAATGNEGAFDFALPASLGTAQLGSAGGLNAAGCEGTITVSNPVAQLGKLELSIYRGSEVVGGASLVTYSTTVGWWYANSAVSILGEESCGSGDSVDVTEYDLELQPGWNLVSRLDDRVRHRSEWSNLSSVVSGSKWLPQLDDAGIGVAPGPFGGPDAGSTATRMVGKLGGWTDNEAATLKVESDGGISLVSGPLSAAGEFDLSLPATVEGSALEPLELTQDCGAGVTQTPANPSGVKAALQPDRNNIPLGTIAMGGRGFTVEWVYAASAVQVSGIENCPSGDGGNEEHRYNINFVQGWNLLIEQVFFKDGLEYTEHKSGPLPAGSQWFFEADHDPGIPDTGSTTTTLSGSVGGGFANHTLRLKVGSTQIGSVPLGPGGEVTTNLPASVAAGALANLPPSRPGCTGNLTVSPASNFGVLSLEVWDGTKFKSSVEITNEDSDGSLEKLYWWYLSQDATVSGTQVCSGQINRSFKYNLTLKAGWNLILEHEEEDPSGDRDTKYSVVTKVPDGTQWGTN
ncbi:MAG: hypothetical protein N2318_04905 [Meiothermus sp.]|nr:hypothetical protein [Meiothermus sp.]